MLTLHTSVWPAGTMYQPSRRLRRDSTYWVNNGVSVRNTSMARALRGGHVGGEPDGLDGRALLGLLIEAQRAGAARQRGQQLDAPQHAADRDDVAVELARRLAGHHVELGAAAGVGPVITAHAEHAITMRDPRLAGRFALDAHGETVDPAGLGRIAVAVG